MSKPIPPFHSTGIPLQDVVSLTDIGKLKGAPNYSSLRNYATGRRVHKILGDMPGAVAYIANRRLWLRTDIELWLTCPLPKWRQSGVALKRWIAAGRPRA